MIGRQRIGLGTGFAVLAESYALAHAGRLVKTGALPLTPWPRYPEGAVGLGEAQRLCEEDPLVRPGLSTEAAALQARLQSWTLKPAIRT